MATGKKEAFDNWLKSVFSQIKGRYGHLDLRLEVTALEKKHWYQLWRIFEENVENPSGGSKELLISLDEAYNLAETVILNAHNTNTSELEYELVMDHYLHSGKYN
ncbi:hypothetical protein H6F67_09495 [Microcoleus sp. FACHB-1515]|uniref:hypothetical protein n=1 Tax=Cyanophyceae TaxID=3028117 RepID=UPI00168657AF|nr:hypothetical protein [Microcoleus sp. FACHB-1515]MBD2090085.1 hypothetical protein [Microcoleus sp. FACHB-1515]